MHAEVGLELGHERAGLGRRAWVQERPAFLGGRRGVMGAAIWMRVLVAHLLTRADVVLAGSCAPSLPLGSRFPCSIMALLSDIRSETTVFQRECLAVGLGDAVDRRLNQAPQRFVFFSWKISRVGD